jgi:tRNA-modifying protein YgfZ
VGQEVTARMKHKTELRKGIVRVALSAPVPVGTAIMAGEREAGTVFTQSGFTGAGGHGIAFLRLDREGPLTAGCAKVTRDDPS